MLKNYLSKLIAITVLVMSLGAAYAQPMISITAPGNIAGDYEAVQAAFGPYSGGQSGDVVLIDDGTGATTGCAPATNSLAGAIALIDRGICGFTIKVANAEAAGAVAVIVCNNDVANPDAIIVMGNAQGDPLVCEVGIPAVMVSYNACVVIKSELANGVTASFPDNVPLAGEDITTAIPLPGAGTYTATDLTGTGAAALGIQDAESAQVYSIIAPITGLMNVNSCFGGADTRVWVLVGCRNDLTVIGFNDDDCEITPGGDEWASSLDVLVEEGQEYLILWDDYWDKSGFDFEVSFSALPSVNVTFNVDMANETVAPSGVKIAGNFTGWSQEGMTDNGDGTWSYTATVTGGDILFWKFLNGFDGWEPSGNLADCGVDDGFGGYNRAGQVGLDDVEAPLVCFSSCFPCPPPPCADPDAIICDNFDSYALGSGVTNNAAHWILWAAGFQDGIVSDLQAFSPPHSMLIAEGGTMDAPDVLLKLGNKSSGKYLISWEMYLPSGRTGYYNFQQSETPAVGWNLNVGFAVNNMGVTATFGQGLVFETNTSFSYPQDTWFEVAHVVDLDNNVLELWIDGTQILSSYNYTGNLGAVNFYSINAVNRYYVDDVLYTELVTLPGDECGDAIDVNAYTGGGLGVTLTTPPYDNTDYTTSASDPTNGWECFGEPTGTGGAPSLERTMWFTFVGDGETYLIEARGCGTNPITSDDTQMAIYSGNCGNLTPQACNDDFDAASNLFFASIEFPTQAGVTYHIMVDGFGPIFEAFGEFCLNFTQLTQTVPLVEVTFQVDLTPYLAAGNTLETVRIAGNFGDNGASLPNWDPPASPAFTHIGDDVYSTTISFPATSAGQNLEYKFLNTATSWGDCGIQQECLPGDAGACKSPGNDNRLLVIPSSNQTLCYTWETCLGCNLVGTNEKYLDVPMTIAPNPFSSRTVVTFHQPIVDGQVRLTALTGQLIRTYRVNGPQLVIENDGLASGVYFINVVTEAGISAAQKLIVE